MKNAFRQGIIKYPNSNNSQTFLSRNGNRVDLVVDNQDVLDYTIAHKNVDYLFSETVPIADAWKDVPPACWLYIDIDVRSGAKTYGVTTIEPSVQVSAPDSPQNGQMWYDPSTFTQFVRIGASWHQVLRIVIARVDSNTFTSPSIQSGSSFIGTQIGAYGQVVSSLGRIIYDDSGLPVVNQNGTFFTTNALAFTDSSLISPLRIDATILEARCDMNIGSYQVVKYTDFNVIELAQYFDIQETVLGISLASGGTGDVIPLLSQGVVTNPLWDWTDVGIPLWVDNTGLLIEYNPHVIDPLNFPNDRPPIARVISKTQIFFNQGMGGRGERGPSGGGANVRKASTEEPGIGYISTPPDNDEFPIFVGDNDPRLDGPRAPIEHNHPATEVIPSPVGTIQGNNLQEMLESIADNLYALDTGLVIEDVRFDGITNILSIETNYPTNPLFEVDLSPLSVHLSDTSWNATTSTLTLSLSNGDFFTVDLRSLEQIQYSSSDTIDISGNGSSADPLGLSVKLSSINNNILRSDSTGIYALPPSNGTVGIVSRSGSDNVTVVGTGETTNPLIITVAEQTDPIPINTTDSDTIIMSGNGATVPLSSNIRIDPNSTNVVSVSSLGLFVPHAADGSVGIATQSKDNVTITGSGKTGDPISISVDPGDPVNAPVLVGNTSSLSLSGDGVSSDITGIVLVDGNSNNQLVVNANGLFVPHAADGSVGITTQSKDNVTITGSGKTGDPISVSVAQPDVNIADSPSVSITGNGIDVPIVADVNISQSANNIISINSDGLLATPPSTGSVGIVTSRSSNAIFFGDGTTDDPLSVSVTASATMLDNSSSVNLYGTGFESDPITAQVVVSGAADNLTSITADGIYTAHPVAGSIGIVSESNQTATITGTGESDNPLSVTVNPTSTFYKDSNSLWLFGTGDEDTPVYGDVMVSGDPNNITSVVDDGVLSTIFTSGDTPGELASIFGIGTESDPLRVSLSLSTDEFNIITIDETGLTIALKDSNTVTLVNRIVIEEDDPEDPEDPEPILPYELRVNISEDVGNIIEAREDGLFIPFNHSHSWSDITSGVPATATRWPTWDEVTSKPSLVQTSRTISAGTGLSGGGNLSANRTLSVDSTYSPNTSSSLSSENLDDLKTPGFYHQAANANATTARNYPTEQAGTLVITHAAGVVQEYTCYNSGNKYYRGFYSTSWGAWKRVVVDTDSIAWSKITGAPVHATRANTWGEVSSKPATATRWPSFDEVTGKPTNYATTWNSVASKPAQATRWPTWSEVTSKPSTFSPSSHNHAWSEVTGAPATATRWPSWGEVTGKPSGFTPPMEAGGVGTYAHVIPTTNTSYTWNQSVAGSNINLYRGGTLSGTWRIMSGIIGRYGSESTSGLAVRIS